MSRGPGLTGDRNFQDSVEFYPIGSPHRTIAYGRTREDILEEIGRSDPRSDWEDHWVVGPTKSVRMGLPPTWLQAPRRYDEYGEKA